MGNIMAVDTALAHAGTIVEALQYTLERAREQARRVTQAGQGIDELQVHSERLAYRATELRAMRELLHYATQAYQESATEALTPLMALAFAAEVGQQWRGEIEAQVDDYGLSEAFLQDTLGRPELRTAIRAGPPVNVPVADPSSADVIFSFPTGVVVRRSTRPVAGSLISRPGRVTSYSEPTRTPAPEPTLMITSPPDTSATSARISTFVSWIRLAEPRRYDDLPPLGGSPGP